MKTFYVIKSLLPFIFLPIAPGFLQIELARQGLLSGHFAGYVIAAQGILTLVTLAWLGVTIARQRRKAFLRMSCVSKKVFFQGGWMTVEHYLAEHHNIHVSHGMTPEETKAWIADGESYLRQEQLMSEAGLNAPTPEVEEPAAAHEFHESAA